MWADFLPHRPAVHANVFIKHSEQEGHQPELQLKRNRLISHSYFHFERPSHIEVP